MTDITEQKLLTTIRNMKTMIDTIEADTEDQHLTYYCAGIRTGLKSLLMALGFDGEIDEIFGGESGE